MRSVGALARSPPVVLALGTLLLYADSLGYGLIWDDPLWLRTVAERPLGEIFVGSPAYQFYRPLTMLYYRGWVDAAGRVDPVGLHAAQVAAHVVAALLVYDLVRRWTDLRWVRGRWTALLAAAIFAVFPFNQQAVAWAGAHQPPATAAFLAAVAAATRFRRCGRRGSIADFGDRARLVQAALSGEGVAPGQIVLRLVWQSLAPTRPQDTVFVHLLIADGRLARGADGDTWGGLLPLGDWPDDAWIEDRRHIAARGLPPATYRITVGLYNRLTRARLPARRADGARVENDEVDVATVLIEPGERVIVRR